MGIVQYLPPGSKRLSCSLRLLPSLNNSIAQSTGEPCGVTLSPMVSPIYHIYLFLHSKLTLDGVQGTHGYLGVHLWALD